MSPNLSQVARDIDAVERKMAGEIEPGLTGVIIAVLVFTIVGAFALPFTGEVRGYEVLFSTPSANAALIDVPSRIFVWFALIFGVLTTMAAILSRRWYLALIAAGGSAIGSVLGMLSIWSRQTLSTAALTKDSAPGPSFGLFLAWTAMIVLVLVWLHLVWQRTALQLDIEQRRRRNASELNDPLEWRDRPNN